jgi:hypothetical protein
MVVLKTAFKNKLISDPVVIPEETIYPQKKSILSSPAFSGVKARRLLSPIVVKYCNNPKLAAIT